MTLKQICLASFIMLLLLLSLLLFSGSSNRQSSNILISPLGIVDFINPRWQHIDIAISSSSPETRINYSAPKTSGADPSFSSANREDMKSRYVRVIKSIAANRPSGLKVTLVMNLNLKFISNFIIFWHSLQLNVNPNQIHSFLIFVPDSEYYVVKYIQTLESSFPILVIPQSLLVPSSCSMPHPQHMLQHLLAADLVQTNFYVTLDSDVIVRKPLDFSSFVIDDGDVQNSIVNNEVYDLHPVWWKDSADLLGIDVDNPCLTSTRIGVTPSILHRSIAQATTQLLTTRLGSNWFNIACSKWPEKEWTDNTLYALTGCKQQTFMKYHRIASKTHHALYGEGCLWGGQEFNWPDKAYSANATEPLVVIDAESTNLIPSDVAVRSQRYLDREVNGWTEIPMDE